MLKEKVSGNKGIRHERLLGVSGIHGMKQERVRRAADTR